MTVPGDALADLGPALPPRSEVYAMAVEVAALARLAVEFSCKGCRQDLPRAVAQIERIRMVVGTGGAA